MAETLLELASIEKFFLVDKSLYARFTGSRRGFRALDKVSLAIRRGEVIGLVGESGSGKSTLAEIAVRLQDPDSGRIIYKGDDVTKARGKALKQFRRRVQMVFQDTGSSLNPRKSIGRHLAQSLALADIPRAKRYARAIELLSLVGLGEGVMTRYPHQLSGGQRQRVAIARSLATEPELLVADEPVASLDVSLQAQIVNLLCDLREKLGLTVLFISHDLALVGHISTRVAVMFAGSIVEEGDPEVVLANPAHPYTRALLAAIPKGIAGRDRDETIVESVGEPASSDGCRFAPRCPSSQDLCRTAPPALQGLSDRHSALCHFPELPEVRPVTGRVAAGRRKG